MIILGPGIFDQHPAGPAECMCLLNVPDDKKLSNGPTDLGDFLNQESRPKTNDTFRGGEFVASFATTAAKVVRDPTHPLILAATLLCR